MGRKRSKTTVVANTGASRKLEYQDDNPGRMPVMNTQSQIAAARRTGRALSNRSGRASTRLASEAGVRSYVGSILGSTL